MTVTRATVTDAPRVRGALAALLESASGGHGLLVLTATRHGRTVGTLVATDGGTFTLGCLRLEPAGASALALASGPVDALTREVCGVIQDIADAFAVPDAPLPCDASARLYAADALLVAEQLRRGDPDAVDEALALAGCPRLPAWLRELAHGPAARLTVSWLRPSAAEVLADVCATRYGWGELGCDDERLDFEPLTADAVRERMATACDALLTGVAG